MIKPTAQVNRLRRNKENGADDSFFPFYYKDQKISTADAKDTSLSTVYDYFQPSTVSSASFSLHDIPYTLSSMFIVTLAENANDSLCHAKGCKMCLVYLQIYVYLLFPFRRLLLLTFRQIKCTSSILQVIHL